MPRNLYATELRQSAPNKPYFQNECIFPQQPPFSLEQPAQRAISLGQKQTFFHLSFASCLPVQNRFFNDRQGSGV